MHTQLLKLVLDFDWDDGNSHKNLYKHDVSMQEAQEIFINSPFLIDDDIHHSQQEKRYRAL